MGRKFCGRNIYILNTLPKDEKLVGYISTPKVPLHFTSEKRFGQWILNKIISFKKKEKKINNEHKV